MDKDTQHKLREPFPAEFVGKLPRVWCRACRDAQGKVCSQHSRTRCRDCGNNITTAHLHLDYVGHAEVTDRLLAVDPTWTWEPVAFSADGLPLLDCNGGLWIRLTVAGVTRLGYGHADGKSGPDAVKESIGDALRNAAMRFGVALDLWGAKFKNSGDDQSDHDGQSGPAEDWEQAQPARSKPNREQLIERGHQAIRAAATPEDLANLTTRVTQYARDGSITDDDALSLMAALKGREVELAGQPTEAAPAMVTDKQHRELGALFGEIKLNGKDQRDDRLAYLSRLVGRRVDTSKSLTEAEADKAITNLRDTKTARRAAASAGAAA